MVLSIQDELSKCHCSCKVLRRWVLCAQMRAEWEEEEFGLDAEGSGDHLKACLKQAEMGFVS